MHVQHKSELFHRQILTINITIVYHFLSILVLKGLLIKINCFYFTVHDLNLLFKEKKRFHMLTTAYAPGGLIKVGPYPLQGSGPPLTLPAKLGQEYFDTTTTPPTFYIFNGQTWVEPSASSASGANIVGPVTINTTGAASTTIGTGGTGTVAIGNATGNTAVTGSLTASTGLVATTGGITSTAGDITATNGNFVSSTAGKGIVLNSGSTSGTTTATLNGRSGQITITTPTINAGASVTLTITNSSITASTTQVLYMLSGGTAFAALTIGSVTNSANQSVVVVQNGTGATNSTASVVLTFLVLN
jgi:hypothetical protein